MKKRMYFLLISCCCLFAFSGFTQQKEWTIIIYLDGSDLESGSEAGTNDIYEMMDAGNTSNVNVVVLTGGANKEEWHEIQSWEIENGEQYSTGFQAANNAMSDPQNLTAFIDWAVSQYPADKYVLDLWNHGMDIRGYGHDENTDQHITVPQLKNAIGATSFIQGGNKFELLGFDACLMATLEVQSTLQPYAHYFVGSEETEPGHGWNYTPIITAMENGSVFDGASLGTVIVDGFKAQAIDWGTSNVTLGVMDMSKIPAVVSALETLFSKIETEGKVRSLQQARAMAEEYSKAIRDPWNSEDMVDLGDLMKKLKVVDSSLAAEADAVLSAVLSSVIYNDSDDTRPHATGISLFLPHNKLEDDNALYTALDDDYSPIDFSSSIKAFISNVYIPAAQSDEEPPAGQQEDDFEFPFKGHSDEMRSPGGDSVSAIRVTHAEDLEQVQVILVEEFQGMPNEFIVLGSTIPDTCVLMEDGSEIFAYKWDELWLGINGYPAYISDIHEFEKEDEMGELHYYSRVHIPAVLNPDDNFEGRHIILSYLFDEAFNVTLESIVPEAYGENVLIPGKERINLNPGDEILLLYESFNEVTDEEFFVVDENAIITIENGNDDLELGYDHLYAGNYHLGYVLMDHSHNDTIIFDNKTFVVAANHTYESFADNNIKLYPNPGDEMITIENGNFNGKAFVIRIYNLNGQLSFSGKFSLEQVTIPLHNLPSGSYSIELVEGKTTYTNQLIIRH